MSAVVTEENLRRDSTAELSNLDCIEPNLWLGNLNAASNSETLKEKKINFILTVNSFPLSQTNVDLSHISTMYIKAFDSPREDLLSHFDESYNFIERGLRSGVVLVHCYHGVSRSSTILVSYVMKKRRISVEAALKYVKSKRRCAGPNPGFLEQLKLYETMNCALDKNNVQYKMFKLYITIDHVKKANAVPEFCSDVIKPDPSLVTVNEDTVYKCKKCRRVLARGSNTIPHAPSERYSWRNIRWSKTLKNSEICERIYFIEPLVWMEKVSVSLKGKLHCPNKNCNSKLGSFSWVTGCQCPCGTHVCPGFYLIPTKVDMQNPIIIPREKI